MYLFLQGYGCCLVSKLCLTLCDPRNYNIPGFLVLHYLLEFAQTHVCWVGWCHPIILFTVAPLSSCPQSFLASGSCQWIGSLHQVTKVLELASSSVILVNIQDWFPVGFTGLISLLFKGLSRIFSSIAIWRPQLFGAQPSSWSNSHICAWLIKTIYIFFFLSFFLFFFFLLYRHLLAK